MTITIGTYNDTMIKADETGYFSLTDMWKANGGKQSQRPTNWQQLPDTLNLLEVLRNESNVGKSYIDLVRTQRGGKMPGTWGLQKVAIAYAEYLSPEFHASGPAVPGYSMPSPPLTLIPLTILPAVFLVSRPPGKHIDVDL